MITGSQAYEIKTSVWFEVHGCAHKLEFKKVYVLRIMKRLAHFFMNIASQIKSLGQICKCELSVYSESICWTLSTGKFLSCKLLNFQGKMQICK